MRLKIALAIAGLLLVFGTGPAQAKGKPKPPPAPTIKTIAGTFEGTGTSEYVQCFWDPDGTFAPPNEPSTPWADGWSFLNVNSQNTVYVKATTLGNAAMTFGGLIFGGAQSWNLALPHGAGSLYGVGIIDLSLPDFPYKGYVLGGTGKFANVTGGYITLDRRNLQPPPPCDGVDNTFGNGFDPNAPQWPGGTPRQDSPLSSQPTTGWIFGDIRIN